MMPGMSPGEVPLLPGISDLLELQALPGRALFLSSSKAGRCLPPSGWKFALCDPGGLSRCSRMFITMATNRMIGVTRKCFKDCGLLDVGGGLWKPAPLH